MRLERFDASQHDAQSFSCGTAELVSWLRRYAKRSQRDSLTRVFVLVEPAAPKGAVVGYFALSMCSVEVASLPESDRARLPRYPVPAVLITRLAVSQDKQGHGLGGALLYLAAKKAVLANGLVAARLLVVDAFDDQAAAFYARFGFRATAAEPRRLYIGLDRLAARLP